MADYPGKDSVLGTAVFDSCLQIAWKACPNQDNYLVAGYPRKDSVPGTAFFDSMDCLLKTSYSQNLGCPVYPQSVPDVVSSAGSTDPIGAVVEVEEQVVGY